MATETRSIRKRSDGRKSLLVYMDAALIKELKKVAVDDDRNAYEIVEEATKEWLLRRLK
ncbi:hypothetical protein [Devosia indica]